MSYNVVVLADSVSPDGVRLTTIQATFPRFLLAEFNTHRVFGRNSGSSRAKPPEKVIEEIQRNPFVPDFNKRVKGMGVGEALNEDDAKIAESAWVESRDAAVRSARCLIDLDVDKSRINRLLEPFSWHTSITTATEWSNFLALRQPSNDDPVPQLDFPAQLEFQIVARMVRNALRDSTPRELGYDDWHLPFVSDDDYVTEPTHDDTLWAKVSSGRCARVSFDTHDRFEHYEDSLARFSRLAGSAHWSAMEHAARPLAAEDVVRDDLDDRFLVAGSHVAGFGVFIERGGWGGPDMTKIFAGHLRGWVCLRKLYENEHDRSLVIAERPEVERQ